MDHETILVSLLIGDKSIIDAKLAICEVVPDDESNVLIEIDFNGKKISKKGEDLFSTLQAIRKDLEQENILILCNGAAKNVYPSPMQMSMGSGRTAYVLRLASPAKLDDVVDIFEKNAELDFTSVDEQLQFYDNWLKSITVL